MCPDSDVNELAQLAGNEARVVAQKGEGLAAGLTSVFAHFAQNHQRRTIAFNSDSPHLPRSVLEGAFETLAAHDIVVGPTHDGGYYLVGTKASHPTLFARDGMGTSSALERLLSRARDLEPSLGTCVHLGVRGGRFLVGLCCWNTAAWQSLPQLSLCAGSGDRPPQCPEDR
jgi:uncharacterized protein